MTSDLTAKTRASGVVLRRQGPGKYRVSGRRDEAVTAVSEVLLEDVRRWTGEAQTDA